MEGCTYNTLYGRVWGLCLESCQGALRDAQLISTLNAMLFLGP
jgi:hypothetical protein